MEQCKLVEFVSENMKTIFAYSLSRVSNEEDAKDLASEIMIAIIASAPKIKNDNAIYGFVWAIASNTYKKYLRNKKRNMYDVLDEETLTYYESDLSDRLCQNEELYLLRRELSLLSHEYRECTIAYYINGMSCQAVSQSLGISLEMVKYYLFKTRKILKEGIGMVREYGEKSYNPGKFYFNTIFADNSNQEFNNLFNRKLTGNILLSSYYTPMTIRELALELGVATVYLEDEINLLVRYNLLNKISDTKYQTNIIILTQAYEKEMFQLMEPKTAKALGSIIQKLRLLLPQIRTIHFHGNDFDDNRLLWSLTIAIIFHGYWKFQNYIKVKVGDYPNISSNAKGIVYGCDFDEDDSLYGCNGFAGFCRGDEYYPYFTHANFNVLGNCCIKDRNEVLQAIVTENTCDFPVFKKDIYDMVVDILKPLIDDMDNLYRDLAEITVNILKTHTPVFVHSQVEHIAYYNLIFSTMGFLGHIAVKTGELYVPEKEIKVAAFGVVK